MLSITNPYVLLGLLLTLFGAFYRGYTLGEDAEKQRQQIEIARLNEEARQKEQALVQSVTNTATELVKANQNAKVEIQKRDAAIAAGNLKLRIPVKTTICPISATADTPAPSGDQPQPTAELDPAVGNALFDLAAIGDEAIRSLNACIAAYDQVRELYSK